jgi:hypothetical protein
MSGWVIAGSPFCKVCAKALIGKGEARKWRWLGLVRFSLKGPWHSASMPFRDSKTYCGRWVGEERTRGNLKN